MFVRCLVADEILNSVMYSAENIRAEIQKSAIKPLQPMPEFGITPRKTGWEFRISSKLPTLQSFERIYGGSVPFISRATNH